MHFNLIYVFFYIIHTYSLIYGGIFLNSFLHKILKLKFWLRKKIYF